MMSKKQILFGILIFLTIVLYSCAKKYYTEYPGKITKGYTKPPKDLKR
jgi:hypothetical protein